MKRTAKAPRCRPLLLEVKRDDRVEMFTKTRNRKKIRNGRRETIHLLLIVLISAVVVLISLYLGITSPHLHEY